MIILSLIIDIIAFIVIAAPGLALAALITYSVKTNLSKRSKLSQTLIYLVIVILCTGIVAGISLTVLSYISEMPDRTYEKMQEVYEEQRLIGLTKEEVTNLLGEPKYTYKDAEEDFYVFDAGEIVHFFSVDTYKLTVYFDTDNKVERTTLKYIV